MREKLWQDIPLGRRKLEVKDERPPLQGYGDQLQGWPGEDGFFWCECGELIKEGDVHICLDPRLSSGGEPVSGHFYGGYPVPEDDRRKMAWLVRDDIVLFLIRVGGYNYKRMGKSDWYHVDLPINLGGCYKIGDLVIVANGSHLEIAKSEVQE